MKEALKWLKRGGVIAFPTDTVYGIGAAMSQERGIRRIYELKKRSLTQPLIAFVSSIEDVAPLVEELSPLFYELAQTYWPGPLTLVLRKSQSVPDFITSGLETLGIRVPDNPELLDLLSHLGEPLITTSANLSGENPALSHEEVTLSVDYTLEGGRVKHERPSTIITLAETPPRILRQGVLEIKRCDIQSHQECLRTT